MTQLRSQVAQYQNITVYTNAKLANVGGYVGNFEIEIAQGEKLHKIKVGAVVVATGANELKPKGLFGLGRFMGIDLFYIILMVIIIFIIIIAVVKRKKS